MRARSFSSRFRLPRRWGPSPIACLERLAARAAFFLGLLVVLAPTPACLDLAPMTATVCGNGVLEPGEDCEPRAGSTCLPAGSRHECRLDCAANDDGVRPDCPGGMLCGPANVCVWHSGTFETAGDIEVRANTVLDTGELDGDGARDLLVSGTGLLGIVHVAPDGQPEPPIRFHDTPIVPVAAPLTVEGQGADDAVDDFVFAYGGLIVQRGGADRSYGAVSFAPVPLPTEAPNAQVSVLNAIAPQQVGQSLVNRGDEVVAVQGSNVWVLNEASLLWDPGQLPPMDAEIGDRAVLAANFRERSVAVDCDELLVGAGSRELDVVSPCGDDGTWLPYSPLQTLPAIRLPQGCYTDGGVIVADVNADGHLDVVAASSCPTPSGAVELFLASCADSAEPAQTGGASVWVAYGAGDGTFSAKDTLDNGILPSALDCSVSPVMNSDLETLLLNARANLLALGQPPDAPLLFDAADFTGDGVPDFVLRDGSLALSAPSPDQNIDIHSVRTARYVSMRFADFPQWDMARVADFNGNGYPDVIVGSSSQSELLFLNGTPQGWLDALHIPLASPPSHMVLGDFDGNLLPDVAVVEIGPPDTLAICFGQPFGAPGEPVRIGRLGQVIDVVAGDLAFGGTDGLDDLLVVADQGQSRSASLLLGSSDQRIYSPFFLSPGLIGGAPQVGPALVEFGFIASALVATELDGDAASHRDVAILTRPGDRTELDQQLADYYLWLLPVTGGAAIDPAQTKSPLPLTADYVPGLDPNIDWSSALLVSADLGGPLSAGGKALEELVVLAQSKADSPADRRGAMLVVTPVRPGGDELQPPTYQMVQLEQDLDLYFHGPYLFDDAGTDEGYRGLIKIGDVTGDGLVDVVALGASGKNGTPPRRTVVVVPGRGGDDLGLALDWSARLDVSADVPDDGPTSFALQPTASNGPLRIVLLSEKRIYWTEIDAATGVARPPAELTDPDVTPLTGGAWIATGDFNGDSLWDLAVVHSVPTQQSSAITSLDVLLGRELAR